MKIQVKQPTGLILDTQSGKTFDAVISVIHYDGYGINLIVADIVLGNTFYFKRESSVTGKMIGIYNENLIITINE